MSIKLLQTMEWTKLRWDQSFCKTLDLEVVLPEVGKEYSVSFLPNEGYAKPGKAFVLWQPPHSELNGWHDKRPTEILKSYVIEGILVDVKSRNREFKFEVTARKRLIDVFSEMQLETKSPLSLIGLANGSSMIQWEGAQGLIKAKVGDYWYLSGTECETSLELIVSIQTKAICVHYSATLHNPADYDTVVTRHFLNRDERRLCELLLQSADEMIDNSIELLNAHEVFGAEYW